MTEVGFLIDNEEPVYLRLFESRYHRYEPGEWNWEGVYCSYWRLYRNGVDGGWLEYNGETYALQGSRLYIIPAGTSFNTGNSASIDHFWIHFDVIGLLGVTMREMFAKPVCLPESAQLSAGVEEVIALMSDGTRLSIMPQIKINALLFSAFSVYMDYASEQRAAWEGRHTLDYSPVRPALQYIERNLAAKIKNSDLAAMCNMNEDYFIERFGAYVNQTPLRYVQDRRLTIAVQRLLFTNDSIDQIAESTGFGNRYHFSKVFKTRYQMGPATYRDNSRKDAITGPYPLINGGTS